MRYRESDSALRTFIQRKALSMLTECRLICGVSPEPRVRSVRRQRLESSRAPIARCSRTGDSMPGRNPTAVLPLSVLESFLKKEDCAAPGLVR